MRHLVRRITIVFAVLTAAWPAYSQACVLGDASGDVIFQSDEDIVVVRGLQKFDDAHDQLLFADNSEWVQCVAHQEDGTPIALKHANMSCGYVACDGLDIGEIARVFCR